LRKDARRRVAGQLARVVRAIVNCQQTNTHCVCSRAHTLCAPVCVVRCDQCARPAIRELVDALLHSRVISIIVTAYRYLYSMRKTQLSHKCAGGALGGYVSPIVIARLAASVRIVRKL
jgi:hypothetical protein